MTNALDVEVAERLMGFRHVKLSAKVGPWQNDEWWIKGDMEISQDGMISSMNNHTGMVCAGGPINYSGSIVSAFEVIKHLSENSGYRFCMWQEDTDMTYWYVSVNGEHPVEDYDLPRAICQAAINEADRRQREANNL